MDNIRQQFVDGFRDGVRVAKNRRNFHKVEENDIGINGEPPRAYMRGFEAGFTKAFDCKDEYVTNKEKNRK